MGKCTNEKKYRLIFNHVNKMQKLKEKFEKYGDTFVKVYESEMAYIYKRLSGKVEYFEVFEKKYRNVSNYVDGKFVKTGELREYYPNDEDFGKFAWCCRTLERAKSYLPRIEN